MYSFELSSVRRIPEDPAREVTNNLPNYVARDNPFIQHDQIEGIPDIQHHHVIAFTDA